MEELLVSSLAQIDALAKLLIEKGLITREEFKRVPVYILIRTGSLTFVEERGLDHMGRGRPCAP